MVATDLRYGSVSGTEPIRGLPRALLTLVPRRRIAPSVLFSALKMAIDLTIFDDPHHQSLELLATQALVDGDLSSALKLADRRCRIRPEPKAHCFVLRSEAFYRLGAHEAAVADLERALQVAPDDPAANRRMLAWGNRRQQSRAAASLLAHERNFDALRRAIQVLLEDGQTNFANLTVLDDTIEGWAVWQNDASIEISVADETNKVTAAIEPDAFHPLADCGHAVSFRVARPRAHTPQSILLGTEGSVFFSARAAANAPKPKYRVYWPRTQDAHDQPVTVIVPVYSDYHATQACLTSLLDELRVSGHRAILVNDATPDARIAKYLDNLQGEPGIEVLVNERNLGFAGATNRGLEQSKQGDVILLNADTIVPLGFINRLAAAARSSADIGTVMPLSNHGFPILGGPIGTREDIETINAIAGRTNAQRTIDIPSGIGFCLYVTRACLDAVGLLDEDFGRGYYEDADFCMRARAHGYRNVCSPSVYIGHAGSMSFGQQKRSLVMRNSTIIDRRYPAYHAEWAAFSAADPLRATREAIELEAVAVPIHPRLLVTGAGAVNAIARERARSIATKSKSVLVLEVHHRSDGTRVELMNSKGAMPQSVQFTLSDAGEREALGKFLESMRPSGIEFFDPANTPFELVDLLLSFDIPYDIFIADGGLLGPHYEKGCAVQCLGINEPAKPRNDAWVARWGAIAESARRILAPCPQAEAFAAKSLRRPVVDKLERLVGSKIIRGRARKRSVPHLGFVPMRSCAQEQGLMRQIAQGLNAVRPGLSITVLGTTLDEIGLMRSSKAFVTGAVEAAEFDQLTNSLGVSHLFVSATAPLFGHPTLAAVLALGLPTAYFDWSDGHLKANKKDLPIKPAASLDDVLASVNQWLPQS